MLIMQPAAYIQLSTPEIDFAWSSKHLSCFEIFKNLGSREFPELVGNSAPRDLHRRAAYSICESWLLIHQDFYQE